MTDKTKRRLEEIEAKLKAEATAPRIITVRFIAPGGAVTGERKFIIPSRSAS